MLSSPLLTPEHRPGFWASANLGRAGYAATTDGMWPYSYWDECDTGILPNQSGLNGESWLPGMRLPGCVCNASDTLANPTPGRSRSAPELDMLEGSVVYSGPGGTDPMGTGSQSLQVAPFDPNHSVSSSCFFRGLYEANFLRSLNIVRNLSPGRSIYDIYPTTPDLRHRRTVLYPLTSFSQIMPT